MPFQPKTSETTLTDELINAWTHLKNLELFRAAGLFLGLGAIYASALAVFGLMFVAPWFYSPYAGVMLSFYGGLVLISAWYSRLNFFDNWPTYHRSQ